MSRDVRELLERSAEGPTRPLDAGAVVRTARRRTIALRAATALVVVAAVPLVVLPIVGGAVPGLEIADRPDKDGGADEHPTEAPDEAGSADEVPGEDRAADEVEEVAPEEAAEPPVTPPSDAVEHQPLDLAVPLDLRLIAMGARHLANQLVVVDLQRGETTVYPRGTYSTSDDPIEAAAVTAGGTIVVSQLGVVTAFTRDGTEPIVLSGGRSATTVAVFATPHDETVWLVRGRHDRPGVAELVDIESGQVLVAAELPPETFGLAATTSGLVLNQSWRDVLLLNNEGVLSEITEGPAVSADEHWLLLRPCPTPTETCALVLHHLASGRQHEVPRPVDGEWFAVGGPSAPTSTPRWPGDTNHGRFVMGVETTGAEEYDDRQYRLVVIDPGDPNDAPEVRLVGEQLDHPPPAVSWDREGHHLVLIDWPPGDEGSGLTVLDVRDGSTFTVPDALPPNHFVITTG